MPGVFDKYYLQKFQKNSQKLLKHSYVADCPCNTTFILLRSAWKSNAIKLIRRSFESDGEICKNKQLNNVKISTRHLRVFSFISCSHHFVDDAPKHGVCRAMELPPTGYTSTGILTHRPVRYFRLPSRSDYLFSQVNCD